LEPTISIGNVAERAGDGEQSSAPATGHHFDHGCEQREAVLFGDQGRRD
jgi:hypothetical protein